MIAPRFRKLLTRLAERRPRRAFIRRQEDGPLGRFPYTVDFAGSQVLSGHGGGPRADGERRHNAELVDAISDSKSRRHLITEPVHEGCQEKRAEREHDHLERHGGSNGDELSSDGLFDAEGESLILEKGMSFEDREGDDARREI